MPSAKDFLYFAPKRTEDVSLSSLILNSDGVTKSKRSGKEDKLTRAVKCASELRDAVIRINNNAAAAKNLEETLRRYYQTLRNVEEVCCTKKDERVLTSVGFVWTNSLRPRQKTKQKHFHFEMANVLFNIGALLSRAAVENNGNTEGQRGEDIRCFQEAASVFSFLKKLDLKVKAFKHSDVTVNVLTMAETLMLAQGQECCVWSAVKDRRDSVWIAQVAKRAAEMYTETLEYVADSPLDWMTKRAWKKNVRRKSRLFEALCQHYSAMASRESDDIATEIARLQQAADLFKHLQKTHFDREALNTLIQRMFTVSVERLEVAHEENESVYLQTVPSFDSLPVVNGLQEVNVVNLAFLNQRLEEPNQSCS